ncbi:MAG TPA: VWD domain-containing protein [Leptospiraceae bacterium]|nr:VWD domain-containing protein [Leptospiraceae bacterium]HNF14050.1 VWD domain-containing protein [Leptospiraceae bacterium]HNF23855.1 VWD domain-containing protein [Leptospiraceae bacterium]HNI98369.1 VWD domain-containing protein [Leptospiraceae bacterium]
MKRLIIFSTLILIGFFLNACDGKRKKGILLIPYFLMGADSSNTKSAAVSSAGGGESSEHSGSNSSEHSGSGSSDDGSRGSEGSSRTCSVNNPGHSWGDPHLRTLDGTMYDFQGMGEFWLIRTGEGKAGIQVRQEPWVNNKKVTVNTAVALAVGTHTVSIYKSGKVYIDKVLTAFTSGKKVDLGDGTVSLSGKTYTISLKEGSIYTVTLNTTYINIYLNSVKITGTIAGLLGNCNGNPKDDLIPRDETSAITINFNNLYRVFGESWRLRTNESWFEYDAGQSLGSFDGLPDKITPLDPAAVATAETACKAKGITNTVLFDACVLDVALTGDPSFADAIAEVTPPVDGGSQIYYDVLAAITDTGSSGGNGSGGNGSSGNGSSGNGNGGNGNSGNGNGGNGSGGNGSGGDDHHGNSCKKDDDRDEHHGYHHGDDDRDHHDGNRDDDDREGRYGSSERRSSDHDGKYGDDDHKGKDREDRDRDNDRNRHRDRKCGTEKKRHHGYSGREGSDRDVNERSRNHSSVKNHSGCSSIYTIWGHTRETL